MDVGVRHVSVRSFDRPTSQPTNQPIQSTTQPSTRQQRTLKDEFLSVFQEEQAVLARLSELEKALEGATDDPDAMDRILQELGDAQGEAERRGVYGASVGD